MKRGLEIHGLLVGKNTSIPLGMICTDWDGVDRIHNFLCKYDPFNLLLESKEKNRMTNNNLNSIDMNDDLTLYSESNNNNNNVNNNNNDNHDNDLNNQKYRKIKEFKSISEKLSENFEISSDSSSKKTKKTHESKYNKKQPKLKSGTQLYALPKNFEENYSTGNENIKNCDSLTSQNYCNSNNIYQKNKILRNSKMVLYASKSNSVSESSITEFDYITFLKKAQKIALIEIEKEEKNPENNIFLNNINSENRIGENLGDVGNQDKKIEIENGENGSYRGVLRDSLKVLAEGLIERDVEVRTCVEVEYQIYSMTSMSKFYYFFEICLSLFEVYLIM